MTAENLKNKLSEVGKDIQVVNAKQQGNSISITDVNFIYHDSKHNKIILSSVELNYNYLKQL